MSGIPSFAPTFRLHWSGRSSDLFKPMQMPANASVDALNVQSKWCTGCCIDVAHHCNVTCGMTLPDGNSIGEVSIASWVQA